MNRRENKVETLEKIQEKVEIQVNTIKPSPTMT
jgi:hypothetical protein